MQVCATAKCTENNEMDCSGEKSKFGEDMIFREHESIVFKDERVGV